jgi:hydrogenase maturation protein HypF
LHQGVPPDEISHRFHSGIVHILVDACIQIRSKTGLSAVALSGGCFQNGFLTEHITTRLEAENFQVYSHTHVPSNDGGIALGQAAIASYQIT